MNKHINLMFMMIYLMGCTNNPPTPSPSVPATEGSPTPKVSVWSVYDPNLDQLWNRVFRQLYRRVAPNGEEYGSDELDPLLWLDTT